MEAKSPPLQTMGREIVLFPLTAMGHFNPMVELGKLLHRHGLSITILISHSPAFDNKPIIDSYIHRASTAHPYLSFHHLSPVSSPSSSTFLDHFRLAIPHLKTYLAAASAAAVILDFFFDAALEIATELHLPCYFFFASNASVLAAFLHLPCLHNQLGVSFKDLGDTPIRFPSFTNAIPASDMPARISDRTTDAYKAVIVQYERLPLASGIIVNSFQSLEPLAVKALMARVYCVGPITADDGGDGERGSEPRNESLAWLDGQPSGSVVFLCFGSLGSAFPPAQIREIAVGLERSGQRFLWVLRGGAQSKGADLEAALPEGFRERTKGRGLVVKSWAPQVAVLGHAAVGGFVTHCGWNSVLESIVAGVAMIAWPLYAEQRMNKVLLVEEARLAAEMRGYKNGVVEAREVEERVRWLMESEGGRELRERAAAVVESGRAAMREGGSSFDALVEMVRSFGGDC